MVFNKSCLLQHISETNSLKSPNSNLTWFLLSAMEASNQIQKLGQQEYRRKNYHAALNFFDSVGVKVHDANVTK